MSIIYPNPKKPNRKEVVSKIKSEENAYNAKWEADLEKAGIASKPEKRGIKLFDSKKEKNN